MKRALNILLKDSNRANAAILRHLLIQLSGIEAAPYKYRLFTVGSEREALDYLNAASRANIGLLPDALIMTPGIEDPKDSQLLKHLDKNSLLAKSNIALARDNADKRQYPDIYNVIALPFDENDLTIFLTSLIIKEIEKTTTDQAPEESESAPSPPGVMVQGRHILSSDLKNIRVLIVDPNKATSDLLTAALNKHMGGKCFLANCRTLKEAASILKRENYDAMVADLNLPDSKGLKTFQTLKASRPELTTLTLVAKGEESLGEETKALGAKNYFIKEPEYYIPELTRELYTSVQKKKNGNGDGELESEETAKSEERLALDHTIADDVEFKIGEALESAPFMMVSVNNDLKIHTGNDAFINLCRLDSEAVIGNCIFAMIPELQAVPLISVFSEQRSYQQYGYRLSKIGQGHYINKYWDLYAWPVIDSQAKVKEVVLIATDVSKRVDSEQERKQLFAALAHDIRNPLLGIKNTLDIVLQDKIGPIQPPRLKSILSSFQKSNYGLLLMLSNIIDVYKQETTGDIYRFKKTDIVGIAKDVAGEVENLAGGSQVTLKTDFEEGIPDINLDESAIRRLFMNLLFNAFKFAEPGSVVDFKIFTREYRVTVVIKNKGEQMGADKLTAVFRGVMESGSIKYGSGLGLYLCRTIAEAHKFYIACRTSNEKGTRFVIETELDEDSFEPVHSLFYRNNTF